MNDTKNVVKNTTEREIYAERILSAPRDLVYNVWTEPGSIKRWWGPRGFRTINIEMNVRPGGLWRYLMVSPDGIEYQNRVEFKEVLRPEKLVYIHGDDQHDETFQVTVNFEDLGGITKMTMSMLFNSAEERNQAAKKHNAVKGLMQTIDRLERYLKVS